MDMNCAIGPFLSAGGCWGPLGSLWDKPGCGSDCLCKETVCCVKTSLVGICWCGAANEDGFGDALEDAGDFSCLWGERGGWRWEAAADGLGCPGSLKIRAGIFSTVVGAWCWVFLSLAGETSWLPRSRHMSGGLSIRGGVVFFSSSQSTDLKNRWCFRSSKFVAPILCSGFLFCRQIDTYGVMPLAIVLKKMTTFGN